MEDMTRSESEPKLTVGEWTVDAGNVLVLDPLLPFYARPASIEPISVLAAAFFWPTAFFWPSAK